MDSGIQARLSFKLRYTLPTLLEMGNQWPPQSTEAPPLYSNRKPQRAPHAVR
jgi:hypothetical protein